MALQIPSSCSEVEELFACLERSSGKRICKRAQAVASTSCRGKKKERIKWKRVTGVETMHKAHCVVSMVLSQTAMNSLVLREKASARFSNKGNQFRTGLQGCHDSRQGPIFMLLSEPAAM